MGTASTGSAAVKKRVAAQLYTYTWKKARKTPNEWFWWNNERHGTLTATKMV